MGKAQGTELCIQDFVPVCVIVTVFTTKGMQLFDY